MSQKTAVKASKPRSDRRVNFVELQTKALFAQSRLEKGNTLSITLDLVTAIKNEKRMQKGGK